MLQNEPDCCRLILSSPSSRSLLKVLERESSGREAHEQLEDEASRLQQLSQFYWRTKMYTLINEGYDSLLFHLRI